MPLFGFVLNMVAKPQEKVRKCLQTRIKNGLQNSHLFCFKIAVSNAKPPAYFLPELQSHK